MALQRALARSSTAGVAHVGEAPSSFPSLWALTKVCFHGFADLPHERGSSIESPNFHCLGHEWYLKLYPGGAARRDEEEEDAVEVNVSLFLYPVGKGGSMDFEFGFGVEGFRVSSTVSDGCGYDLFLKHKTALTYLVKGSLVIEVWMRPLSTTPFIPTNPSSTPNSFLASIFNDHQTADIQFKIGSPQNNALACGDEPPMKTQKTSMITLSAHCCVLMKMAPMLAEFCKALPGTNMSPTTIELPNESVQAFEALLRYIYGLKIFYVGKDICQIKDILKVADKYRVVILKLEAEDLLISSITLGLDNVVDYYLYAHDNTLALLTERVMDFVADNWDDFHASNKISEVPEELMGNFTNDLMVAVRRPKT